MGCVKSKKIISIMTTTIKRKTRISCSEESDFEKSREISDLKSKDYLKKNDSILRKESENANINFHDYLSKSLPDESDFDKHKNEAGELNSKNCIYSNDWTKQKQMRMTLKGIYESQGGQQGNFTFALANETYNTQCLNKLQTLKNLQKLKSSNTYNMNNPQLDETYDKNHLELNKNEWGRRSGDISIDSIISCHSLLSENHNNNLKNLLEDGYDQESDSGNLLTATTDLQTIDPFCQTEYNDKNPCLSTMSATNINNLDDSFRSINPIIKSKILQFLPIHFDIFDSNFSGELSKKIFLLNLYKSLQTVAKFINSKKNWEKSQGFVSGHIHSHLYLNNFDLLNNHTYVLDKVIPQEQKDFMVPLYQLISNNLEVKVTKLKSLGADNILNNKFKIGPLISRDLIHNRWEMRKCQLLGTQEYFGLKIIDKKRNKNTLSNEYLILNRMVFCNYSLQIKEIITSNDYDYLITEYVDSSLYDYIVNEHDDSHPELIWKLLRNLVSAIDYCHTIARVVHRNLNLHNIFFFRENYMIKISDFTLSGFLLIDKECSSSQVQKYLMPAYPPPDYMMEGLDSSEDIWAAGIILHFMLYKFTPVEPGVIPKKIE